MKNIEIKCENCSEVHAVPRTSEIPDDVVFLRCNWCPACYESATEHYKEWYNYEEVEIVPENQLKIFGLEYKK